MGGKRCEHGIVPVTDCLVCVSAPHAGETDAWCPYFYEYAPGEKALCHLVDGHDGPHLVDVGVVAILARRLAALGEG